MNRPFHIQCNKSIFTDEEIEILEKYGKQFQGFTTGERPPKTQGHDKFIEAARGKREPETIYEMVSSNN